LYWTKHALFWGCAEERAAEFHPDGVSARSFPGHITLSQFLSSNTDEGLGELWLSVVEGYTHMRLSFESDRLTALAGLASRLQDRFGDEYLFGIWKSQLLAGITWRSIPMPPEIAREGAMCVLPSWSWAGSKTGVSFPLARPPPEIELLAEVVGIEGEYNILNPVGKDAFECKLRIRGKVIPIEQPPGEWYQKLEWDLGGQRQMVEILQVSRDDSPKPHPNDDLACFPVWYVRQERKRTTNMRLLCLLMAGVSGHPCRYRRIGFADIVLDHPDWLEPVQTQVVELV